jgi:DNA-binding PadR family transcriptional regulator
VTIDDRILSIIRNSPSGISGAKIWYGLGRWRKWWVTLSIYPALARLERAGRIKGVWVDEPYPRRRLYHIVTKSK